MKDLLVHVADADAEAVFTAVLARPQSLGIRAVSFDVQRNTGRDCGVVKNGADLARFSKKKYHKALLVLDFHGSGREGKGGPADCAELVQQGLDLVTWSGNSAVAVLVPELEEWLWRNRPALAAYFNQPLEWLEAAAGRYAEKHSLNLEDAIAGNPKEVWEHVMKRELKRTISPADFRKIAEKAGLTAWRQSPSFERIVGVLQAWFPPAP
jgi:hypothetical protein